MPHQNSIFVEKTTGRVGVMQPAPQNKSPAESQDNFMLRSNGKVLKNGNMQHVENYDLKIGAVPMRCNRNAWEVDASTGKITVNLALAYRIRTARLVAEWRHWKKTVEETLEFAQGFGDAVAIKILEQERTRVASIPALIRTELDRFLADGDEAAIGQWVPDWPDLTGAGLGEV